MWMCITTIMDDIVREELLDLASFPIVVGGIVLFLLFPSNANWDVTS